MSFDLFYLISLLLLLLLFCLFILFCDCMKGIFFFWWFEFDTSIIIICYISLILFF